MKKTIFYIVILFSVATSGVCQSTNVRIIAPTSFKQNISGNRNQSKTQTTDIWPRIFDLGCSAGGLDITESYDSGYIITGTFVDNEGNYTTGIIMKTDVNGNPMWQRHVLSSGEKLNVMKRTGSTKDGGCISTGLTTQVDNCLSYICHDAWIIKFDACGNKEWCKVYSVPMDTDYGVDIVQNDNGNYIALVNLYGTDSIEERIWLFCLSSEGDLIWQKVYLTSEHPQWATNGYGHSLLKDNDGNLFFTGECVVYDNYINPTQWAFQILHIKFSPEGDEIWGKPWHMEYDSNKFYGYSSSIDFSGNFITGGSLGHPSLELCHCHPPALLRITNNGVNISELLFPQGLPAYYGGGGNGGSAFVSQDRVITATQYWDENGFVPGHNVARLCDTLGNILDENFQYDELNEIKDVYKTTTNNVLMTAGFYTHPDSLKMFLYKYTSDLTYPPLDTRPLVYDYLCPEAVKPMDTIVPDCDIIVGLEEPMHQAERYSLLVSPNPASEQLTLTLPDRMMKEWESNGLSSRTLYYTLPDNLQLQFTDALGRMHQTLAVAKGTRQVTVDVSRWPAGVYLARLTGGSTVVADVKVVVR